MRVSCGFGSGLALLYASAAMAQSITGAAGDAEKAVVHAVALLPQRPPHIVILERSRAAKLHPTLTDHAEAFVSAGSETVYLIREGDTLVHAAAHGGIFEFALAIVIWHEMGHLSGATEREAQAREEQLWEQYIVEGRIDRTKGLAYLDLLRRRHDPVTAAAR